LAISEAKLQVAEESFSEAAVGLVTWTEAMSRFADAVGSRTGQLIGIGSHAAVPFNIMTEMAPEAEAEFVAVGGGDPWINSRVRVGIAAPELALRDDADFTIELDRERGPEFGAWKDRHRIGYSCIANVLKNDRFLIGMAALRDSSQEPMDEEDKQGFAVLARSLRSAVRLQVSLEGQEAKLVAKSFEAIDKPVFVCAPDGTISGASGPAQDIAATNRWLTVRRGRLSLRDAAAQRALLAAIGQTIFPGSTKLGALRDSVVTYDKGGFPLYLEIAPFPIIHDVPLRACALVIAYPPRQREERCATVARALYRLTPTEAMIAAYLVSGKSLDSIADLCGIGRGTVRTHLKRTFDKTGVRSQVGLVSLLSSIL
jgi:DNA-binding CsgD family transcriptional regulator